MKKQPPKPNPKTALEYLDPVDDYVGSFLVRHLKKILSLVAFRNYLMIFLASYILTNSEIRITLFEQKINVDLTFEFVIIVTMFSLAILIFYERREENNLRDERIKSSKLWKNYVLNIQPFIKDDPDKMVQLSLASSGFLSTHEIEDYIIKVIGPDLKSNTEMLHLLEDRVRILEKDAVFIAKLKTRLIKKSD